MKDDLIKLSLNDLLLRSYVRAISNSNKIPEKEKVSRIIETKKLLNSYPVA